MANVQVPADEARPVPAPPEAEPLTVRSTVADQHLALEALHVIHRAFAHLPSAHFGINSLQPTQVDISCHDGLGDFETWREALGIVPEAVRFRRINETTTNLVAAGAFAGARIALHGFAPVLPNLRSTQ